MECTAGYFIKGLHLYWCWNRSNKKSGWLVVELMREQILVWYVVIGNEGQRLAGHQIVRACNDFSDNSTLRHCLGFPVKNRNWCIPGGNFSFLRKLACGFLASLRGNTIGFVISNPLPPWRTPPPHPPTPPPAPQPDTVPFQKRSGSIFWTFL